MYSHRRTKTLLISFVLAALAGCGGGGGGDSTSATQPPSGDPGTGTASVSLAWTPPADSRVVGYRVYYGTSPRAYQQMRGAGLNTGGSPSYTVQNLTAGTTYYFAVTSYDASSNESDYSAEAAKLVN